MLVLHTAQYVNQLLPSQAKRFGPKNLSFTPESSHTLFFSSKQRPGVQSSLLQTLLNLIQSPAVKISFIDNNGPTHPEILKIQQVLNKALIHSGKGLPAYANDPLTQLVNNALNTKFASQGYVYFVPTGTGANILGIQEILENRTPKRASQVLCSTIAHLVKNESIAPQIFTRAQFKELPTDANGKIILQNLEAILTTSQTQKVDQALLSTPAVLSITQPTELGTLYTVDEIVSLCKIAHQYGIKVHMDGARLSNAAVALNKTLAEITTEAGVDILSFGLTKNGLAMGTAVLFLNNPSHLNDGAGKHFKMFQKQGLSLVDKTWQLALPYWCLLEEDRYLQSAKHANEMARFLEAQLRKTVKEVDIVQPVHTNAVFIRVPKNCNLKMLHQKYDFYEWSTENGQPILRIMTQFYTQKAHLKSFLKDLKLALTTPEHENKKHSDYDEDNPQNLPGFGS